MSRREPILTDSGELFSDSNVLMLVRAAEAGDVATIERLIRSGVDVNSLGRGRATPLSKGFDSRNKAGYSALLKAGANPNILNAKGNGVINRSALVSDPYWLKEALAHGGDPNAVSKGNYTGDRTPLFYAIGEGRTENVRLLIAADADVNFQDQRGISPLLYAGQTQEFAIALVLLHEGADFHLKDKHGQDFARLLATLQDDMVHDEGKEPFLKAKEFIREKSSPPASQAR